jgi:hypothetical protein
MYHPAILGVPELTYKYNEFLKSIGRLWSYPALSLGSHETMGERVTNDPKPRGNNEASVWRGEA